MAESEEKLCKVVSEFGGVSERRKLTVNVGKSNDTLYVLEVSRCGTNAWKLNGEPFQEVDCFTYPWSQMVED